MYVIAAESAKHEYEVLEEFESLEEARLQIPPRSNRKICIVDVRRCTLKYRWDPALRIWRSPSLTTCILCGVTYQRSRGRCPNCLRKESC